VINKLNALAENCVNSNPIPNMCEELQNFNTYFMNRDYDAFLIDNALKGNILNFTLLYVY
jgi:hypothetical protein